MKYCSIKCRSKGNSIYNLEKNIKPPSRKGKKLTDEQKLNLSIIKKKTENPMKRDSVVQKMLLKKKEFYDVIGRKTKENHRIRMSKKYKLWRKSVFERDNYTCQFCNKKGGKLNADHIKQFAFYPELRFDIGNGRTLCVPCHRNTDTFACNVDKRLL